MGAMQPRSAGGVGFEVSENVESSRFELRLDGELVGFAQYQLRDGTIVVPYVETIAAYRGNGYGARLMDGLLAIIDDDGRRIVPLCSFARGHIDDSPQHHHLLA
jgi:predicted GNAT family acetyltransferase